MKKIRTLETIMEEMNWPSRSRWKARVGYGEGFLEIRSVGSWIRGNMTGGGCERVTAQLVLIHFASKQTTATAWIYQDEEEEEEEEENV